MADVRYQIAINGEPDAALSEQAAEVEVQQTIEGPTTFRVRFAVDICDGDLELLEDERLTPARPDNLLTVVAVVDGESYVLAHGLIVERQVSLTEGGSGSWLEVRGQDRRAVMNREQRTESHSGVVSAIVAQILERYGFDPDVVETSIEYSEDSNTCNQAETDLAFVEKHAGRNGFRFWLDWELDAGLAGVEIKEHAHFKPSPPRSTGNPLAAATPALLAPDDAPELRINSGDGCSNLQSFELSANSEAPNQTGVIDRIDPNSAEAEETEVPGPTDEPLGEDAPLGEPITRRIVTAGSAEEARVRNEAALNDAAWSVQATAQTSVHALGAMVAPHQVVRVTGGGRLNSGDYFVKAVAHQINPSEHTLRIELMRNALGGA